jgi:hypothetical protein
MQQLPPRSPDLSVQLNGYEVREKISAALTRRHFGSVHPIARR